MKRTSSPDELRLHAMVLWPHSVYLQHEWVRAIRVVRQTRHGWLLDRSPSATQHEVDNIFHLGARS